MMITGSSTSPFAAIESVIYKTLFAGCTPYAAITGDSNTSNTTTSTKAKESSKNRAAEKAPLAATIKGQLLKANDKSENSETTSHKKTN